MAMSNEDVDADWYHKEMNDIAVKKQMFLNSTSNNDRNNCMKCSEGGQLLICSSESCSFMFHDSCMVSDTTEKFYCPFCKYSQSISNFWIVKRKASLARNDVASFNGLVLKYVPQMSNVSDQIKSCKRLAVPQRRRVPVPWTQLEEDTLKLLVVALQKWMEKLSGGSTSAEGFVPWRKILQLGDSVFQKSRTPVDLKDKWRNMQKATNKST